MRGTSPILVIIVFAVFGLLGSADAGPLLFDFDSSSTDQVFQRVLQVSNGSLIPEKARREMEAGVKRFRAKDHKGCRERFKAAVSAHPSLPPARVMLARLFLATGGIVEGRRELEQAAVANMRHPEVYLVFGDLALAEGRNTDAYLHFEQAARLIGGTRNGTTSPRTLRHNISVCIGLATIAERRADWGAAEDALSDWLKLAPKSSTAQQRLGLVLFRLDRSKEAFEALSAAVAIGGGLEPAAITMAWLYQQAGNTEKADAWIDRAIKLHPADPQVFFAAVMRLLELGRVMDADIHIKRLNELEPDSSRSRRVKGLFARYRGEYATSEQIFETLYRESPADFDAVNQLSLVLVEQEDRSKRQRALQLAEINARQFPKSPVALGTLGWVYFRVGQLDKAERLLQAAVSHGNVTSETTYYLARVIAEQGRTKEARLLLREALAAHKPFPLKKQAHRFLKKWSQSSSGDASH